MGCLKTSEALYTVVTGNQGEFHAQIVCKLALITKHKGHPMEISLENHMQRSATHYMDTEQRVVDGT